MKTNVVIPVKPFALAKGRLSLVLSPEQRMQLAEAMLRDVLQAARAATTIADIYVVSSDPQAAFIAGQFGARVIDDKAGELNGALEIARNWIRKKDPDTRLLVLPSDLPVATGVDIDAVSRSLQHESGVAAVPAHDRDGTNALLLAARTELPFAFGPCSFERHVEAAQTRGIRIETIEVSGLEYDLDQPQDLEMIARHKTGPHTSRRLEEWGYCRQLAKTGAM